jgi:hypothetical protein
MTNRIFNIVGWLGTAAVVAAVAIRFFRPIWDQYAYYLAWAGLVLILAYMLSQWREIAKMFSRRQARYGTLMTVSVLIVLGILVAINYIGRKQNKRWDFTANKQFSPRTRRGISRRNSTRRCRSGLRRDEHAAAPRPAARMEYTRYKVRPSTGSDKKLESRSRTRCRCYHRDELRDRTERVTSNTEQTSRTASSRSSPARSEAPVYARGEKDIVRPSERLQRHFRSSARTTPWTSWCWRRRVRPLTRWWSWSPTDEHFGAEIDALKSTRAGGKRCRARSGRTHRRAAVDESHGLAHDWGIDAGPNVVVDVSGTGQLFGASEAGPLS